MHFLLANCIVGITVGQAFGDQVFSWSIMAATPLQLDFTLHTGSPHLHSDLAPLELSAASSVPRAVFVLESGI